MDDKTIKEISDVITAEVMKQVQANLSAMKPHIIEEITNNVLSKINFNNNSNNSINTNPTNVNNQQQLNHDSPRWGTPNLSDEQRNKILTLCQETNKKIPNMVDNEKILSITTIEYIINSKNFLIQNGWIYYIKKVPVKTYYSYEEQYRLFRVRTNGIKNTKLTDEEILYLDDYELKKFCNKHAEFYIEGTVLHYTTKERLPRTIDISKNDNNGRVLKKK